MRVAPGGELDLANAATLQAQLDELRGAGFQHVMLDLRELTFIDSSAVRLILREDRLARSAGRRFSLIQGPPAVQRVLDVCDVLDRLDFGEPVAARSVVRRAPSGSAALDRPHLGIAFQCYLAELRQQGRATSRLSARSTRRTHAH
ncbi:MAG: STAS domain-containing protein [Actinobacteria bacterium]|nr:STAS domain-containing protein [Actinomycetota bacterium]